MDTTTTDAIASLTITNEGSGYDHQNPPIITCPGGSTNAVLTPVIGIVSVSITNKGTGYDANALPTITCGGGGSNFAGTASLEVHTERVKLWVDNSIIIQQWTSLHTTTPSGTIAFGRADGYYDISALYKCSGVAACNYQLQWESTVSGVAAIDVSKSRIRSDRLFQRLDVPNGPSGLHVQPAVTCAAESTAKAPGVCLSVLQSLLLPVCVLV